MTRRNRILAATATLIAGLVVALPFRKADPPQVEPQPVVIPAPLAATPPDSFASALPAPAVAAEHEVAATAVSSASPVTSATLAPPSAEPLVSYATTPAPLDEQPTDRVGPLPGVIYQTVDPAELEPPSVESQSYVIHNGDTLEKIAARYLGDPRRALEIFDLNHEVLANPHVLPIGAELALPPKR